MAALEPDRLVVRVVYAGAPMAGKTATVRALMPLLKGRGAERLVSSPLEHRGRTAFFDWADYEGGAFEGRPIHCQIASAPGQVALSDRRELLIRGADAVILVVDSQSDALERTLQCHEEMLPWLEDAGRDAPIRVLLQCNKQDLPGSLSAAELSQKLGLAFGKDVYATSARTTKGLRAAFVAGVRAAVERARLLLERGLIATAPEIAGAEALLERMQRDTSERRPVVERAAPALALRAQPGRPRVTSGRLRQRRTAGEARSRAESPAPAASKIERAARRAPGPEPAPPAPRAEVPNRSEAPPSSRPAPKDWTPGRWPRPAVMPASAYYALVGPPVSRAEVEAWGIPEPGAAAKVDSIFPQAAGAAALSESPKAPSQPALRELKTGRGRPAVMPASAHFAEQAPAAGARSDSAPAATPSAALLTGAKRPAVMPASAYFALLRQLQGESGAQPPEPESRAAEGAALLDVPIGEEVAPAAPIAAAESAPADGEPREEVRAARPAVIPMAAWLGGQWTTRARVVRGAAVRAPRLDSKSKISRPAVMPASAWRAMERRAAEERLAAVSGAPSDERATLAAVAAVENDDTPSPESGFVPRAHESAPGHDEVVGVPRLPGQIVPRSAWPRATWRELATLVSKPGLPRRDLYGRFIAEIAPGWYARSLESAPDLRAARRCLAKAVLRQRSLGPYLSGPRCLALTEEPDRFWVWQIVYRVPTLAIQLGKVLDAGEEPSAVADVLLEVATGYLQAREKFAAAPEPLPLSLQALSAQEGKLVYAGLLPKSDSVQAPSAGDGAAGLEEALRRKWPGTLSPSIDAGAVVAELQRKAVGRLPDPIVEIIRDVLIRH